MVLTEYGMLAVMSVEELCFNEAMQKKTYKFTGKVKQSIGAMIVSLMFANGYN